jgi:hypothetical protein
MMETFEIIRENDGFSLGMYKAGPHGELVSKILKVLKKQGLDGSLIEGTMLLSDNDELFAGIIYKFRPSIDVPSPGW